MPRHLPEAVYAALVRGDEAALREVLSPDFVAVFAAGMPVAAGEHRGADAAIREGWWAIGAAFSAQAHPVEFISCGTGRLLVRGVYRGTARATGHRFEAAFFHLWTVSGEQLVALEQLTDTAAWQAAYSGVV